MKTVLGQMARKFLLVALMAMFAGSVFASSPVKKYGEGGGDGAPWPFTWGKECPFPWDDIEGDWTVVGSKAGPNTGHKLVFTAEENVADGKLLFVEHYDLQGQLLARGTGYADTTNKVTKSIMSGVQAGEKYRLLVRSYSALKSNVCSRRQVMAVTFCPVRGKKCMETSNYTLSR